MTSDETLYHKFINGDEAGLRGLMKRHGDKLLFYLCGYTHNIHDAEDLMIEAFARVAHVRPKLRGNTFRAYLYKTARNLAIRFCEQVARRKEFGFEALGQEPEATELVESVLLVKEREEFLHARLDCLEPRVREALWLVYFEEMSYEEAARIMRVKRKQVDYLLQKGRRLLKADFERGGGNARD